MEIRFISILSNEIDRTSCEYCNKKLNAFAIQKKNKKKATATNHNRCLDSKTPLDRCAKTQLQQNQPQTMVLNILKSLNCHESRAPYLHQPHNIVQQL